MDKKQFFDNVVLMRANQREYFKTRSKEALRKSKVYESIIDKEIERVRAIVGDDAMPKMNNPPSLFNG